MDRQLAGGLGLALSGSLLLVGLGLAGELRPPLAAAESTHPAVFLGIGVGLLLMTVGTVVFLAALVGDASAEP